MKNLSEAPVVKNVDIIVCGGGPAGIGAAISAARQGLQVALIEQRGFLGGNITACFVESCNYYLLNHPFEVTGIYKEIENEYRDQYNRSDDIREDYTPHRFSSEYLKIFLDEKIQEEGIWLRLHTSVTEVIKEDNKLKGVITHSKSGFEKILGDVVIDCTGDGDVAAQAEVPFEFGREEDGLTQPGTVNFRITGVDTEQVNKILNEEGAEYFYEIMREKYEEGTFDPGYKRMNFPFGRLTEGGQISYINFCNVYKLDSTDADDITKGEVLARKRVLMMYKFMKENLPGFENIELTSIAPSIGFRDSRRIKGEYKLTEEDIENEKIFEDNITIFPCFYDMLSPTGTWDDHIFIKDLDKQYSIPYRSLLPINVEQLIVAGRCISTDHVAESSVRAISACMSMGQAAGVGAAVAVKDNCSVKKIDVDKMKKILIESGVKLSI
ncbi:MAG: FAD-dependent oxidoreductase [Halothermotrichaceae bacterium]